MSGKAKSIVRAAAPRARRFLGLSVPIVTQGAATGAGILATNWLTAQISNRVATSFTGTWWGKAGLKVGIGLGLRYAVRRVNPQWANYVLAGALASATLSVAKQFMPSYDTSWGLAGVDDDSGDMSGLYSSGDLSGLYSGQDALAAALAFN